MLAGVSVVRVNAGPPPGDLTNTERAPAIKLTQKGIPNFGQVSPTLFRGGQPSADGIEALKQRGVDIVVNLREPDDREEAMVKKLGMQYVSIPTHCPFPKDEIYARFLKVIREHPGRKVFVHCRLGKDRTGMAVASYRMAEQGWSPEDAMNEMRAFGFNRLHHAMCPGMGDYVEKFPEVFRKNAAYRELPPEPSEAVK